MIDSLLASLRREQRSAREPDQHVFRLTHAQESEIIDYCRSCASSLIAPVYQPEHIERLYGCSVELVD